MASLLDGIIDGRLVNPLLPRHAPRLFRLAQPFGFRLLGQDVFERQTIGRGQELNALENLVDGFTHETPRFGKSPMSKSRTHPLFQTSHATSIPASRPILPQPP